MNVLKKFAVIGAGSWGTALACIAARATGGCILYSLSKEDAKQINEEHKNSNYLGNTLLPKTIEATNDFKKALEADVIILATPSDAFETTIKKLKKLNIEKHKVLLIATKGLCAKPVQLFSEFLEGNLENQFGFISGPNFAKEVAENKFSSITITSKNIELASKIATKLTTENLEVTISYDIITVQIAGIVKNIIAIKSGIDQAKGGGENAKAWLVSKGLEEISLIANALGGNPESLTLPAVIGDLALTSYSNTSRNTKFGYDFHNNKYCHNFLKNYPSLVEGVNSARLLKEVIKKHNLKLPTISSVIDLV